MNLYQLIYSFSNFTQYPHNIGYNPGSETKILGILNRNKDIKNDLDIKETLFKVDSDFRSLSNTEQDLTVLLIQFKNYLS